VLKGDRFTTSLSSMAGTGSRRLTVLGYMRPDDSTDPREIAAHLQLRSLSETDPITGRRRTIKTPAKVRVQAVAGNPIDALELAADNWCATVGHATLGGVRLDELPLLSFGIIT
jgi:hypothetical protein